MKVLTRVKVDKPKEILIKVLSGKIKDVDNNTNSADTNKVITSEYLKKKI